MLKPNSRSSINHTHNLLFTIEGATITADEMGAWVSDIISNWESEHMQEDFAQDASCVIVRRVLGKVKMAKAQMERTRIRNLWIKLNPPNHAGYYYCHIGGEWVAAEAMELDHVVPSSIQSINTDNPDWQDKLRPSCSVHNNLKGSRQISSTTFEICPPDEEC